MAKSPARRAINAAQRIHTSLADAVKHHKAKKSAEDQAESAALATEKSRKKIKKAKKMLIQGKNELQAAKSMASDADYGYKEATAKIVGSNICLVKSKVEMERLVRIYREVKDKRKAKAKPSVVVKSGVNAKKATQIREMAEANEFVVA